LLGLVITFLLIMRSSSVLDLLLNFSAIEFVTNLDNVVFELAKEGFLGHTLKKEAKKLCRKSYYVNIEYANSYNAMVVSLGYFIVLFASFFGGWLYIYKQQRIGEYLCHQIFSQFGDDILPMLGTFTGLFYKHTKTFGDRASYRDDQPGGPLLAYCKNETRWTLSLTKDLITDEWNPCNWLAASSESESYSILSTTSSPWVVNTPSNRVAPLTHHFLMCYECSQEDDFCGDQGKCSKAGKKFDQCLCNNGYYGLRCEYSEPCQVVEAEGFSKEGGGQFTSKYYRLEDAVGSHVDTYYHPVYTSLGGNESLSNGTDFVFFTGERWIMSYKYLFPDLENVTDKNELAPFFRKFHGYYTNYSAVYESEPVYLAKLLSADQKASPLSIRWRLSSSDTSSIQRLHTGFDSAFDQPRYNYLQKEDFIETELSCAVCSEGNPCIEGVCLNGTCDECPDGYSGSRCEIPPKALSDGHCDPKYNTIKFEFDGGDCCDNTCKSTLENTCGKTGLGYIDTGYSSCVRAYNQWDLSAEQVKGVSSASQSGQAVALSGNGKILAVADPGLSIVRLFDKDGAEWKQRGQHIQGKSDSNFGASISLSSDSFNIAGNPRTSPRVTLGVGAPKASLVRVFTCTTDGCIQKGGDIFGGQGFGSSLSISENGESLVVSRRTATNGEVAVFTLSNDTWEQRGSVAIAAPLSRSLSDSPYQPRLEDYYFSLSGDDLAVGRLELEGEAVKLITQVFKWNNSTGWDPSGNHSRHVELATLADLGSWSIDLSEDASILAIGTNVDNPLPTDESIRIYKWNGKRYNALFNGVPAGPAASLSLSSDGKAVAVGLPYDSSNGGSTRVYNFYPEFPCDDPSEQRLRISFTTDGNPQETSWELRVDSKVKLRSGPLSGHKYTTFVEEICVPADACVRLRVFDIEGDGLNYPGVFALMLNGKKVVQEDGDFGRFWSYDVNGPSYCDGYTYAPSASPVTQFPSASPTVTQPPSASPVEKCEDGGDLLKIEITLGEQPWDSYWYLTDQDQGSDNDIIFDGPYQVQGETIVKEVCKPVSAYYRFRLESTDDAYALIYLNGNECANATTKNTVNIPADCTAK